MREPVALPAAVTVRPSDPVPDLGLSCAVEDLGMGVLVHPTDKNRVRLMLKPWIVEAALTRLGDRRLSLEQRSVVGSTQMPEKVLAGLVDSSRLSI